MTRPDLDEFVRCGRPGNRHNRAEKKPDGRRPHILAAELATCEWRWNGSRMSSRIAGSGRSRSRVGLVEHVNVRARKGRENGPPDPRGLPNYRMPEAAHYLGIPPSTVRWWTLGQRYRTVSGVRMGKPVIAIPQYTPPLLSFINLVALHVLDGIRHQYQIPLPKVRVAVEYVVRQFSSPHPLAHEQFETDGVSLLIRRFDSLINASERGQLAMTEVLKEHLQRIERDEEGLAVRLYPFTRHRHVQNPKLILIDPRIAFGRPVLAGTGIATSTVAERYKAGESIAALADDYGRRAEEIEEAVRCELHLDAA